MQAKYLLEMKVSTADGTVLSADKTFDSTEDLDIFFNKVKEMTAQAVSDHTKLRK